MQKLINKKREIFVGINMNIIFFKIFVIWMNINCMDTNILYLGILHGVFMLTTSSMTSKFDVCDVSLIGTLNLEAFFLVFC